MKKFARKSPLAFSFILFLILLIGGSIAGIILGLIVISGGCNSSDPHDICDGPAMAAGFIWTISLYSSLFLGFIVSILTYISLKLKTSQR